jgi:hypothetical protein
MNTNVFKMDSRDRSNVLIATGALDNVRMTEVGTFDELSILRTNVSNTGLSEYTVEFKAKIPVF